METMTTPYPPITPEDCAVIYGADPHKSAYTLWAEKRGLVPPRPQGEWRNLNRELEPVMARLFRRKTGLTPRRRQGRIREQELPWAVTDLGWEVEEQDAGLTLLAMEHPPLRGGLENPTGETYQCLHRMLVLGKSRWYLGLYLPGKEFVVHQVTATERSLRTLAQGEAQFWHRVTSGDAPMPDGSDSTVRTLEELYPQPLQEDRDLTPAEPYIRDYLHWKALEEEAAFAARARANVIKAFLGPCARGHVGAVQVLWPLVPQQELDLDALQQDHPELSLDSYRRPARRFRVEGALPDPEFPQDI